jgi:tetratricopeptide (TPR) repeat protein
VISKRSSQTTLIGRIGLALALVLTLAGVAAAADKKAEAEVHYDQGKAYYKAGAFDLAIQEFLQGYKLDPRPGVLFNIARGYEELKDRNKAIEFYKKYIDQGAAAAAATEARARMVVLERQIKDEDEKKKAEEAERERQRQLALNPPPAAPAMPAPVETTAPAATSTLPAAPAPAASGPEGAVVATTPEPATSPETAKKLKVAGLVTGGAGVVLAGVGTFFAIRAGSLKSEIQNEVNSTGSYTAALASKNSDMESAQTMAVIGLAAGGVAIAGGAVLYYLGWKKTPHDGGATAMLSPGVTPGGGSLFLTGRF